MNSMRRKLKAGLGMLAALMLALVPTSAMASPQSDQPVVVGDINGLDPTTFNPARLGQLHISKTAANPYDDPKPGSLPNGPAGGQVIQINRVKGIDLPTADWTQLQKMTVKQAEAKGLEPAKTMTTDDEGNVTFANLPVGLYLVSDQKPADTTHKYGRIKPFLITMPSGNPDLHVWTFNISVAPKMMAEQTPAPSTPSPTKPHMPKTGVYVVPFLIAAAALFSTGILVAAARRHRQDEEAPAAAN